MPPFIFPTETVFIWAAPPIKFGLGAIEELGYEVRSLGIDRCLILTDPGVAATGVPSRINELLAAADVTAEVYEEVGVEPTDESIERAVLAARRASWDGYLAVGGGSVIDTAKAVNLLTTHPGTLLDYIAKPIGKGRPVSGAVKPLIAVPTTAGTGSEATAICVVDLLAMKLKAGISHPRLRPALAVIDPLTTLTLPPEVTAASGMDVLTHAIESYTCKRFDARPAAHPDARVSFAGANPISDLWAEKAMELVGRHLRQAVHNGNDVTARYGMALAATFAGIGFGNAGTHIPHANAYPIAGQVRHHRSAGYPEMPMVPHGQAVASTTIPAFRFTYASNPERHLYAASLVAGRPIDPDRGAEALPGVLRDLMIEIGIPLGIAAFGFTEDDIDTLVEGTLKQSRQLAVAPRDLNRESAAQIFRESLAETAGGSGFVINRG